MLSLASLRSHWWSTCPELVDDFIGIRISTDYVRVTSEASTTVSVIARQTATPDFVIYRGADAHILPEESHLEAIEASRVVHTSAFALSREPARSTILQALQAARQSGCLVSLDPNYHPHIWPDVADSDFLDILAKAYQSTTLPGASPPSG